MPAINHLVAIALSAFPFFVQDAAALSFARQLADTTPTTATLSSLPRPFCAARPQSEPHIAGQWLGKGLVTDWKLPSEWEWPNRSAGRKCCPGDDPIYHCSGKGKETERGHRESELESALDGPQQLLDLFRVIFNKAQRT
ncbi:hypothetical protein ACLKA7_013275 [Drosophila subpalustris]